MLGCLTVVIRINIKVHLYTSKQMKKPPNKKHKVSFSPIAILGPKGEQELLNMSDQF